ncbi:MAG: alcohol dehydrogenase catalytic domain-containing protein, partial [Rubrobacteraceae bacterium]
MRALTHVPTAPHGLAPADVAEPAPGPAQALVEVHASSINFGELTFMAERRPAGHVPGNDAAGVVLTAAADGSGPPAGTRVVGFAGVGAWAERVAIDTDQLAILPDDVDAGEAATLPAAATTALRALRGLGPVLGRRVLVTGASGGVGRFAVQLAAQAGA